MARKNPAFPEVDVFVRNWAVISGELVRAVRKNIRAGMTAAEATNVAFVDLKIRTRYRDELAGLLTEAVKAGAGATITIDELAFRKWYLAKHWPGDPLTLSAKITRLKMKSLVVSTIRKQLKENRTISQTAKALTDRKLLRGDIAKHIQELERQARRVAAGDATAFRAYRKAMAKSRAQIEKLAQMGAPFQRLKKAYGAVLKATEKLDTVALDRAISRSILAKARYNAERIARTEIARAYGVGFQTRAIEDDDAIGIRWSLSTRHNVFDICDLNAKADLYGMGPGVYPKDKLPMFPAHPHCMCVLSTVYKGQEKRRLQPEQGEKWVRSLDEKQRKELMGAKGARQFRKHPNLWRNYVKGYEGPQPPPVMPKRMVS